MAGGLTRNNPGGNPAAPIQAGAPPAQAATGQAGNLTQANAAPVNALASSALDNVIPVIKEPKESDILAKFKYKQLDKIDGEPTYPKLVELRRQLARNARAVKSSFGGGKNGHEGLVLRDATFVQRAHVSFVVPASKGAYPTFVAGATDDEKKIAIAEFILSEQDILKAETCGDLLKNQLLDAVEEKYFRELRDRYSEYDDKTVLELLEHLFAEYAQINDTVINMNIERFNEPPDMDLPIDAYFNKQEECQEIAEDSEVKITDEMMVQKLTTHMGKTGLIGNSNYKFKQQQQAEKTWKKAKKWYREALSKLKSINEESGLQTAFSANNMTLRTEAEEQAKAEISKKLGESFDALAMAATAKTEIHDSQAGAIATLTATNATLVTTNAALTAEIKKLTAEVMRLKTRTKAPAVQDMDASGSGTKQAKNTSGKMCAVRKGGGGLKGNRNRLYWKEQQYCKNCDAKVWHVPGNCPKSMENKKRKAEELAKAAEEAAEACKEE